MLTWASAKAHFLLLDFLFGSPRRCYQRTRYQAPWYAVILVGLIAFNKPCLGAQARHEKGQPCTTITKRIHQKHCCCMCTWRIPGTTASTARIKPYASVVSGIILLRGTIVNRTYGIDKTYTFNHFD